MRSARAFVGLILILFAVRLAASDTYEQELSSALATHIVVLRQFYTDAHLKFDSDGKLASKAKPGFGPTDGRVYVQQVQLTPNRLILTGARPLDVFKQAIRCIGVHVPRAGCTCQKRNGILTGGVLAGGSRGMERLNGFV